MAAKIQRTKPLTITEQQRRWMVQYGTGEQALAEQELVTTSDQQRLFRRDTYLGPVDHGSVDTVDALATIYLLPTCTRGVWPDDTCWVASQGCEYRCISGSNATAVWRAVGAGQGAAGTATWGGITGSLSAQADLAGALGGKWPTPGNAAVLLDLADDDGTLTYKGAELGSGGGGVLVAPDGPPIPEDIYTFASNGDANGLIYAIATRFGAQAWVAPGVTTFATAAKVGCLKSSHGGYDPVTGTVARDTGSYSLTTDTAGSWFAWDLGGGMLLRPTSYTLRNQNNYGTAAIRTWKLQGTNEMIDWTVSGAAAAAWTDIDVRSGDTTMAASPQAWARYLCTQPAAGYRFWRVLQTGLNAAGNHFLCIGEVEFYGSAPGSEAIPLPEWANTWMTDNEGHYWPAYVTG